MNALDIIELISSEIIVSSEFKQLKQETYINRITDSISSKHSHLDRDALYTTVAKYINTIIYFIHSQGSYVDAITKKKTGTIPAGKNVKIRIIFDGEIGVLQEGGDGYPIDHFAIKSEAVTNILKELFQEDGDQNPLTSD
jgi:hypothetical protein